MDGYSLKWHSLQNRHYLQDSGLRALAQFDGNHCSFLAEWWHKYYPLYDDVPVHLHCAPLDYPV